MSGATITGPENVLLHVIGMKWRAKTIHDIQLLTNRTDTTNLQYGLRKLIKLGFVEKEGSGRVGVTTVARAKGERICKTTRAAQEAAAERPEGATAKFEAESVRRARTSKIEKIYTIASREAATFHRR